MAIGSLSSQFGMLEEMRDSRPGSMSRSEKDMGRFGVLGGDIFVLNLQNV